MTLPAAHPLRLLAGLVSGLILGLTVAGPPQLWLAAILTPVGSLWLDALTMTVVPLVFGLLATGVASAARDAAAARITGRALAYFAAMLAVACIAAAVVAEGLLRAWPVIQSTIPSATAPPPDGAAPWYRSIIPANPIKAAAETAMVPLVVFALFFGFAIARIGDENAEALLKPLRALVSAMLVIVGWVLSVGPLGIAALAFGAGVRFGTGLLGALGQYVLVVVACCLAATLLAYGWATIAGRLAPIRFGRALLPAQAVALGTQSSLATLPLMVEAADRLSLPKPSSAIVLPLAVSLFRAASAAANVGVALYLAHLHGVSLGISEILLAAMIAVPVSLGAVGLPAQISFFATIAPICIAVGIPVSTLPLLLAIEAIPDLFRTLGNVTNDVAAAAAVGRISCDTANKA